MKKTQGRYSALNRVLAFLLAFVMVAGYFPTTNIWSVSATAANGITTVADPQTLTRPQTIYGNNTLNAGKVTVGKSVSTSSVTVNGQNVPLSNPDNFLVTVSQSAQVMGLAAEVNVPVDVVFVLDTSGSMWVDTDMRGPKADGTNGIMNRSEAMVQVINDTISKLMKQNSENRVGVVAFSAHNLGVTNTAGNADNDAAIELSPLASYSGNAATKHLTYGTGTVNWVGNGNERVYTIHGREADGDIGTAERYYIGGATNIQAGIAKGAKMLMNASLEQGNTRVPFLIVLSDGAPTVSSSNDNWWEPDMQRNQGNYTYANGNDAIEGNSFLTLLTAAYYKNKVSQHYTQYTAKKNDLTIYTIGYGLDTQNTDYEIQMSQMTLNPLAELLENSGNFYQKDISDAWTKYANHENFTIQVGPPNGYSQSNTITHDGLYYFYNAQTTVSYDSKKAASLTNRQPNDVKYNETWVNVGNSVTYCDNIIDDIIPASKSLMALAYNDNYYNVANASELQNAFSDMLVEISKKAISAPTKVDSYGADFSGYVTFTDPIGEYMEFKDMKGILANGKFYKGATAAKYMAAYGTSDQNAEFNALLEKVLTTRMSMTASSSVTMAELLANADGNSFTWWGKTYAVSGEEDVGMQVIAPAADDSVDYITSTTAPAGADHVCRSYFFYGTAGDTSVGSANAEYLYFVVRVQRSLKEPYQQTVVISAPASLLSMEKVLITESKNDDGETVYTASVEKADPARVVYEVGLRSDITAENVATIVADTYKNETVKGTGTANYNASSDSYTFFTNDWDRTQDGSEHHRAMAKATFDAAADNAFYTYQEDTLVYVKNGDTYSAYTGTAAPIGEYYYARDYYEWTNENNVDGDYAATPKTAYIKVEILDRNLVTQKDNKWYINKGVYTASTLETIGDDTIKDDPATATPNDGNVTGTAYNVSQAHRTGDAHNSHYTVLLGNNGKLTLKANTPEPKKTVQVGDIVDADGKEVKIGDQLTYTISVKNALDKAAEYTITDKVPAGTSFVSADNRGSEAGGTVTWKVNIPAGQTIEVKMVVQVTKDALKTAVVPGTIKNTAVVTFPNGAQYTTNPVENPPYGKEANDSNGNDTATQSGYKVGDVITYSIRYHNNVKNDQGEYVPADITITDMVPEGTELVANNPISHGGTTSVNAEGRTVITWTLADVQPNMAGVVTFRVKITADAVSPVTNSADIVLNNDPNTKITTNPTETKILKGDLVLTKTVADGDKNDGTFELTLTESTGKLSGTFSGVTFVDGYASVTIEHNQTITISDLPAGVKITVAELAPDGWTATYNGAATAQQVTITADAAAKATVNVNNDYHAKPVTFQLKGTKTFVGETFPAGATFTFRAVQCDANGNVLSNDPITVTATATSPNGEILFSARVFTTAIGERYYKITEDASTIPGLITDNGEYLLYLNVTDDGEGNLQLTHKLTKNGTEVSAGDNQTDIVTVDGANFTNIYPKSTSITLGGDKTLSGRYQNAGEFEFQLLEPLGEVGSSEATVIEAVSNTVNAGNAYNGSFAFKPITYTAADMVNADGTIATEKTFTYYIREVKGAAGFVTYDSANYVVTVTVTRNGGALSATVKYDKWTQNESGVREKTEANVVPQNPENAFDFVNVFKLQDTRVTLSGTKILTGRALKDGEFSFSAYKSDANGAYTETVANLASSGINKADGTIVFSPIGFNIADMGGAASKDFYFVVKEDLPIENGATVDPNMYYDPTEYLVKITVTYDASKGTLTAGTPEVVGGGAISFNNIQNPDRISVIPVGQKITKGVALPAGLRFSFRVTSDLENTKLAGTGVSQATDGSAESTNAIDFTALVITDDMYAAAQKDANGIATFTYYIFESNTTSNNGVDYDESVFKYEVSIKRDEKNKLIKVENSEKYYKQQNDGSWKEEAVLFENKYTATGHIDLTAAKTTEETYILSGNDFDFRLQRLDANGKLVAGSAVNGFNDKDGKVTFATLNFSNTMLNELEHHDAEGENAEYWLVKYLMGEIKPDTGAIPGVNYDTNRYIVTIKLTTDGSGGIDADLVSVLKAQKNGDVYTAEGNATDEKVHATEDNKTGVTFTNTYSVQQGTKVTIEATKTLTGRDFVMSGENKDIGEFGFALYRYSGKDAENKDIWRNIGTAFNAANGKISFTREYKASNLTHIAFDDNNEYKVLYRIDEINGGLGGVEYSKKQYFVEVIVVHNEDNSSYSIKEGWPKYYKTMNADGTLSDEVGASDVVFDNKYKTNDTSFKPTASKELKVWDAETQQYKNASADGFSFEVVEVASDGTPILVGPEGKKYAKVVATGHSDADGSVIFDDVIFNGAQELAHQDNIKCTNAEHGANCEYHKHYYMIRENAGSASGITYDTKNHYITVEIHDNGAGELSVQNVTYYSDKFQTATNTALFTNYYGPGSVNLDLQVNKVVEVKYPEKAQTFALRGTPVIDPNAEYEMAGSEFDFEVYKADASFTLLKDADGKHIVVASGTNEAGSGEAKVPFGTITYTRKDAYENGVVKSGEKSSQTYYYVIKELPFGDISVPGVTIDTKEIHVTVMVTDDGYGNMTATAVYANDDKTFTNTYEVKDPVSVTLTAVKELIGKDMETFTFQLKDKDGKVLSEKNNDGTTVTFDALTFYLPGTYTYTVSEVIEGKANMTYDETVYTVTIEVWDDREGQLYTVVTMTKPGENDVPVSAELMKFTNSYKHPDLTVDLSTQINAEKTVAGEDDKELDYLLKKYQFQFEVIDLQGNPVKDSTGEPMIGVTDENGNIIFPSFKFDTAGEYHYLIREIEGFADRKITTDDQVWCAHIKVVYNRESGLLEIDPTGCTTHLYKATHDADQEYANPVFVNKYDPEKVSVTVKANKELTGRELKNHEFTFRLLDEHGYIAAEAKNHADGSITFQLNYELADLAGKNEETFSYTLVEVVPDTKLGGVTYTTKSADITVKVTDNQEGKLTAEVTGNGATFTNQYNAEKITAVIEAIKNLDGKNLEGNEFSFYLKDVDGNTVKDADGNDLIVKNDADGKVRFQLDFTQDMLGTDDKGNRIETSFNYTVHEVKGDLPGVTYDESSFEVTVTVRDNYQGKLTAVTTYAEGAVPVFVNTYETDDALVTIHATKELTGKNLAGEDFEFQLVDEEGNVVDTAKNDADGKIRFDFTLAEAGEYTFTILEVAHEDGHYSHDERTYKVTVKVKDNGEGKLIAEDPVYEKTPVFQNTYTPDGIKVTVEASKLLSGGKTLKANDFEFQLLDAENKVVASAKNTAEGKISFQLDIDAVGTYTYTMAEKDISDDRIACDTNKYTVTIKVTNVNGVLTPVVSYGTDDGKAPMFQNTWKPEKIGITLTGTKTLTGRDMKAGEFKFQVHDSTGTLVATGTNDAKGNITFTPVGIVTKGTYLLTVSEVKGTAEYVTYDNATFQVKVVVENVDGVLVPTVTYPDGDIAFENSYDEPANPETGDNAPIYWMVGLLVFSALAMVLLIALRPKKKGGKYAK